MTPVVSALGLVTSLGHDAVTCCAAIRAGLTRAASLPDTEVLDPDTHTMVPAVGHAVFNLTGGKSALARWLAMGRQAFIDLCHSSGLPGAADTAFWERTGLGLIVPVVDDERFMFFEPFRDGAIQESYVRPLVRSLAVPINSARVFLLAEGRTGAVRALAGIDALFDRQPLDRIILLATDSYLDGHSLEWLVQSERLKQAELPAGLMPGEAAAAVMIEREEATDQRGGARLARVTAARVDSERETFLNKERKHGRAIARAIRGVLGPAGERPFSGDVITDLNGEAWRAYEFGAALTQVPRTMLDDYRVLTPAASTGELGAASGLTGLIIATKSFARGYASSSSALITCVSGGGRVGAILMVKN